MPNLEQDGGPHCKSCNGLQVLHSPVGEREIFCGLPQSGVDINRLGDIAKLAGLSAHTVEPDTTLRDVLLQAVERQPQVVALIGSATGSEKRHRIDRGMLTEAKIASGNGKLDLLVMRQIDAGPVVGGFQEHIDLGKEAIGENLRDILCRLRVPELERREERGCSHQPVAAYHAEDAADAAHKARAVVTVEEVDLGDNATQLGTNRAVVLVAQRDEVLRMLGRTLANLSLGRISDNPATGIEGFQVFLGADELVTVAHALARGRGEEGRNAILKVSVHVSDSSKFLLRLKGKVRKV